MIRMPKCMEVTLVTVLHRDLNVLTGSYVLDAVSDDERCR